VGKNADNELSLIDFDADVQPNPSAEARSNATPPKGETLEDDLLGLSFQDKPFGQTGGIALGFGANTNVPGPSLLSSSSQQSSAKPSSPAPPPQYQQAPSSSKPNYDPFASITNSHPTSRSNTPGPGHTQAQSSSLDPFASLASKPPQQPSPAPSPSMFNFASPKISTPATTVPSQQRNGASTVTDDDWNFASALPADNTSLPSSNEMIISKTSVTVAFRTYTLQLTPQSGRTLQPNQVNGITQPIEINGVPRGSGNSVKMRWKASYKLGGAMKMEQGEVGSLGII
ncbi:MAG: hypothetical protein Q9198_005535, partial [Flavoplaca austrocitrina]